MSRRPLGLVVQLDGARDLRLDAAGLGVVAAHQPLQLGELADHARHQVGLGELRRAPRILRLRIHRARDLERQLGDALHALLLAAQLLVEGDAGKRARHLVERLLEVLLPEELGVRQPRRDHLLVAGDDLPCRRPWAPRFDTSRNLLASLPERGCFSEKHFWCCFMDSIRHSAGTSRNASSKRAHQHGRPLGEPRVLGQQRLVLDQRQLVLLGQRARLLGDQRCARSAASRITLWLLRPLA